MLTLKHPYNWIKTVSVKTYGTKVHHWSHHSDWCHHTRRNDWCNDRCHTQTGMSRSLQSCTYGTCISHVL